MASQDSDNVTESRPAHEFLRDIITGRPHSAEDPAYAERDPEGREMGPIERQERALAENMDALTRVARMVRHYRQALIAAGFSEDQATEMVREWHRMYWASQLQVDSEY